MLHCDKVSVINSASICLPILKLGMKVQICFNPSFPFSGCWRQVCCLCLLFEPYSGYPNLVLPSQWGDLAPFLLDLMQHLPVDPHLMHSKCVLIWWLCLRHSMPFTSCTAWWPAQLQVFLLISRINVCKLNFSLWSGNALQVLICACVGPTSSLHIRVLSHCSHTG